jgi:hypothetical protein
MDKFVPLISRFHSVFAAFFRSVRTGTTTSFAASPDNRDALPVGKSDPGLDFPRKLIGPPVIIESGTVTNISEMRAGSDKECKTRRPPTVKTDWT